MRSTCLRVAALLAAFAFTASAPASAAVKTWNLASEFAVPPNQVNPGPDGFGNTEVWSFRQSATLTHSPADYTLLTTFEPATNGVAGLVSWQGSGGNPPVHLPAVLFNSTAATVTPVDGVSIPARSVAVHPLGTRLAVVGWRSPVAGTVSVTGGVADRDGKAGNGVDWWVDKGATTLANGAIANGGNAPFTLSNVPVAVGDVLYFVVGPGAGGDFESDTTGLDITITHPLAGGETTTTLASSAAPSVSGQRVTFTATVAGATPPAGAVQFEVDGANAGAPVPLDAQGKAGYATASLAVGDHTVKASFQPSAQGVEASRAALAQHVGKAATATAVTVAPDPSVAGQNATFTATVTPVAPGAGTPTGSVQFADEDGTPIGPPQQLVGGSAVIVASGGAGTYNVSATYSGDGSFSGSAGSVPQLIQRAATATTITSDVNPVAPGADVTFTITVTTLPPGGVAPAGSVAILIDGFDVSGPLPLFDDGPTRSSVAVTFTAPSEPQSASISATYSGDWDTAPSASPSFVQTVGTTPLSAVTPKPPLTPSTSGSTPSVPTSSALDTMASTLVKALKRRGLRALASTSETLAAKVPGTLTQRVYSPTAPKSPKAAAAKPALLASLSHKYAVAGSASVKLRLTAAGKKAVKRARPLKLAIVTTFTPKKGTPVTTVARVRVTGARSLQRERVTLSRSWVRRTAR